MVSREILENYIYNKQEPPPLYIAILANDLHGAFTILNSLTGKSKMPLNELLSTVEMVHRYVPFEARGSLFKVERWIGKFI